MGGTVWISLLAVQQGITKVNCSFTGTGEVTPRKPPSLSPSLDFSFPLSCLITPLHKWMVPLIVSPGTVTCPPAPCLSDQGQGQYRAGKHNKTPKKRSNNSYPGLMRGERPSSDESQGCWPCHWSESTNDVDLLLPVETDGMMFTPLL